MNFYDKIFQDMSDEDDNKNQRHRAATLNCLRVLNDIVKPAIKELDESKLRPNNVKCNEEDLSILVAQSEKEFSELFFVCVEGELRMVSYINGLVSDTSTSKVETVSSSFVRKHIGSFLQEALKPRSKDQQS